VALLALYIVWGSTYLAIRFAIETIPPFLMAGTRFLVAGSLLLCWMRLRGAPWPKPSEWREASIVGGLMLLGGNGGVCWAEQTVPSGVAALVVSTVPIWVVLLDWLWLESGRPNASTLLGLTLGFGGVALLIHPGGAKDTGGAPVVGILVLVLASGLWAAGALYSRRARLPASPWVAIAMEMVAGGALLALVGTAAGEWRHVHLAEVTARSLLSLAYLVFFGSLIGFSAYLWLLKATTPARASTYAFVNPVVAVFLGWAFAGEAFPLRTMIAAAVALTGVVLIVRTGSPS
jgi:drug/metabolite transporter (DMT)-like permease